MNKPSKTMEEDFSALDIPESRFSMSGTNLISLKNLNSLPVRNTRMKLRWGIGINRATSETELTKTMIKSKIFHPSAKKDRIP